MKASIVRGIILAAAMAIAAPALAQVVPRPDSGTADAGIKSKPIANVVANDTINGAPAVLGASGNATIESSGMWPPGLVLNTMSGALTTATTLAAGVYSVSYELCDLSSNCASTTDTVTVITPVINPLPGSGTADFGVRSQPIANVAANDTVNGAPAILGAAGNARVLQSPTPPWPTGIVLNTTTGAVTTTSTIAVGTYNIAYYLCDWNVPADCQSTTDTVTVIAPSINPVADAGTVDAGVGSQPITNVAANDTVNGAPAALGASGNATVAQRGTWPPGITLTPSTGAVNVAATVAVGTYNIAYVLCDRNITPVCASTLDTVTLIAASVVAPDGCPIFHCTVEATGVISQPLIEAVSTMTSNSSLGDLPKQGCSGNGSTLTCLFSTDNATGIAQGTLKVLDATTLQPIWGSAGAAGSYNLDAASASGGQVPVNFADGSIAAGDLNYHVLYNSSGAVIGKLSLQGKDLNFGLTPISDTYGVVSQANGVLTLVEMPTWTNAGTLVLLDPVTKGSLQLVSPSSGTANVLYAVAQNKANGNGFLFAVVINSANKLEVGSVFPFIGQSGASPVVVTPSASGLSTNLILLHVPGLIGDTQPQNRLLGLSDSATGLQQLWAIPLTAPLVVSPAVDQSSMSLFYHQNYSPIIHQNELVTGAGIRSFNLQAIAGVPGTFGLNTHLGASQPGSLFTLLLGGAYTSAPGVGAEYVMAFQPIASPGTLLWSEQISSVPANYLAAWNFAPSSETGIVCPIALADNPSGGSAIVRLCDF